MKKNKEELIFVSEEKGMIEKIDRIFKDLRIKPIKTRIEGNQLLTLWSWYVETDCMEDTAWLTGFAKGIKYGSVYDNLPS